MVERLPIRVRGNFGEPHARARLGAVKTGFPDLDGILQPKLTPNVASPHHYVRRRAGPHHPAHEVEAAPGPRTTAA